MSKLKLLFFVSDDTTSYNSSRWRVSNFVDAAWKHDKCEIQILNIREWLGRTEISRYFCEHYDVIILQRVIVKESVEYAQYWIERGKKVICDWDDGYLQLVENNETTNPAFEFWGKGTVTRNTGLVSFTEQIGYDPLDQFAEGLSALSAGTVPSRVIQEDYREWANVFYLPNFIDAARYAEMPKKKHEGIRIGYGGSLGHLSSFRESGVKEALSRVLEQRASTSLFLIGDNRLIDALDLPPQRVIYRPYVPYYRWPEMIAHYDISIAPLAGEFDMRRSFLKAVEASVSRTPLIATGDREYPVYAEFFGCPGQTYVPSEKTLPTYDHRVDAWETALLEAIDNLDSYKEEARVQGFEYGMTFDIEKRVDDVLWIYEQVMELP